MSSTDMTATKSFIISSQQRLDLQNTLNRECEPYLEDLSDAIASTIQEYAEALNSDGDSVTTELIREELLAMVQWNDVLFVD